MRIIYFEEDGNALHKVDYLNEVLNHEVWVTQNFLTLLSWLDCDPGYEHFDALMFDLNIASDTLPILNPDDPYNPSKHHSPSLYLIKYYIQEDCSEFIDDKKIIICSGFFDTFEKMGVDLSMYHKLDKTAEDMIEDLKRILQQIEEEEEGDV